MFTIAQLEIFVEIVESGTFAAAAKRRGVTQGAVSNMIKYLENKLETDLFFRDGMYIALTRAGEVFLMHARTILDEVDRAVRAVHALRSHAKK